MKNEGRSFWKWLVLWARAVNMDEARKKRIMRENLETWNRENRDFIKKCEREDSRKINQMTNEDTVSLKGAVKDGFMMGIGISAANKILND